jgi:hypothetical protein
LPSVGTRVPLRDMPGTVRMLLMPYRNWRV